MPQVETTQGGAGLPGRAWRAARATVLVATLGVAVVVMVEPPGGLHPAFGDPRAAQPHVPTAERWITLGIESPSSAPVEATSAASRAIQTPANDRSRHSHRSADDRSRR